MVSARLLAAVFLAARSKSPGSVEVPLAQVPRSMLPQADTFETEQPRSRIAGLRGSVEELMAGSWRAGGPSAKARSDPLPNQNHGVGCAVKP